MNINQVRDLVYKIKLISYLFMLHIQWHSDLGEEGQPPPLGGTCQKGGMLGFRGRM